MSRIINFVGPYSLVVEFVRLCWFSDSRSNHKFDVSHRFVSWLSLRKRRPRVGRSAHYQWNTIRKAKLVKSNIISTLDPPGAVNADFPGGEEIAPVGVSTTFTYSMEKAGVFSSHICRIPILPSPRMKTSLRPGLLHRCHRQQVAWMEIGPRSRSLGNDYLMRANDRFCLSTNRYSDRTPAEPSCTSKGCCWIYISQQAMWLKSIPLPFSPLHPDHPHPFLGALSSLVSSL